MNITKTGSFHFALTFILIIKTMRPLILAIIFTIINGININPTFSMQSNPNMNIILSQQKKIIEQSNYLTNKLNNLTIIAANALTWSQEAYKRTLESNVMLDKTEPTKTKLTQEQYAQKRAEKLEDTKILIQEKIKEKRSHGIYTATEQERWKNIREILKDLTPLIKIGCAITVITTLYYIIKHGTPMVMNHFTRPKVISETSKKGLFNWKTTKPSVDINNLVFQPPLQQQLADILLRIQTANEYNENLPNLLFFGEPGTGKTAFAKALAYESGLDYAITSGSEFAKITDLNLANDELRKLLNWAKNTKKGLIVIIDEAESLFANKAFSTTPKITQDLINTFLTLISDQSQKNVMFVLATNHPFKLDNAVISRIGINIEFVLPRSNQRERILFQYLEQLSQENDTSIVEIHPEIMQNLSIYAQDLEGFSPRTIKFVAENMIISARRQGARLLTNDIALLEIAQAKQNLEQNQLREDQRDTWIANHQ